jgi:hypothetical protein
MFRFSLFLLVFFNYVVYAQPTSDIVQASKPDGAEVAKLQATVTLVIQPWGEVFLDGKSKGISPPVKSINVGPGEHTVIIKNADKQAYEKKFVAKAGDAITIKHMFAK